MFIHIQIASHFLLFLQRYLTLIYVLVLLETSIWFHWLHLAQIRLIAIEHNWWHFRCFLLILIFNDIFKFWWLDFRFLWNLFKKWLFFVFLIDSCLIILLFLSVFVHRFLKIFSQFFLNCIHFWFCLYFSSYWFDFFRRAIVLALRIFIHINYIVLTMHINPLRSLRNTSCLLGYHR